MSSDGHLRRCLPENTYSWPSILVLGLDIFLSYLATFTLAAYAPELLHIIGVPWESVGYNVGTLNNIIFASSAIGSVISGVFMTYVNHKKCLVGVLFLQGASCIIYGFSRSTLSLFISVSFVGLFAVSVCGKTYISEICNEDNEAHIIAWTISGPIAMTSAFGPALGGYLLVSGNKFEWLFAKDSRFRVYPLLLLMLIVGSFLIILSIVSYFVLPDVENMTSASTFDEVHYSVLEEDEQTASGTIAEENSGNLFRFNLRQSAIFKILGPMFYFKI